MSETVYKILVKIPGGWISPIARGEDCFYYVRGSLNRAPSRCPAFFVFRTLDAAEQALEVWQNPNDVSSEKTVEIWQCTGWSIERLSLVALNPQHWSNFWWRAHKLPSTDLYLTHPETVAVRVLKLLEPVWQGKCRQFLPESEHFSTGWGKSLTS